MRVLVDATPLLGARTGVGVFTAHLLDALDARPGLDVGRFSVARRGTIPVPARAAHALWRRLDWPPLFKGADVVHGTNFVVPPTRAARVVTVHDLTVLRFPELVTAATRAYPDLIRQAVGHGAWVHTPSAFVAAEVAAAFPVDPARVRAIPHGVVPVAVSASASASDGPAYDFPYVLALGTVEPRKDLPSLVRAFDALAADTADLRLVVAGPDGWGVDALDATVARSPFRARIVRLGHVADDARQKLLAGASVLAYPSLYEGFGLPPLEAMAAGVPVVAARAGGVTEAVGDAAVLVEPGDADALAQALALVLHDDGLRGDLIERGRTRAAGLRWEDTAAAMEALYRDAICES
jgi:glycosyltransferase involved in cell wall biosynthesis